MELSPVGRLTTWLAVGVLIVGALFANALVLLIGVMLFLYLFLQGVASTRIIRELENSVTLETHPSNLSTGTGTTARAQTAIKNGSGRTLRVTRIGRKLPRQITEETEIPPRLVLPPFGKQQLETLLKVNVPGKFEASDTFVEFELGLRLFRHSIRLSDSLSLTAWPRAEKAVRHLDTDFLYDLMVDPYRHGIGTDISGVTPSLHAGDFHRIDWKATARAGMPMTRVFHLEKDPTVMLLLDVSSPMRVMRGGVSALNGLLNGIHELLADIRPGSSVGIIAYDDRRIVARIDAGLGPTHRNEILRTVLNSGASVSDTSALQPEGIRTSVDLSSETSKLMRDLASVSRSGIFGERVSVLVRTVLPYYRKAQAKHNQRLKRQGVYLAFEAIRSTPQPMLVILITNNMTNLDGLVVGSRNAAKTKHRLLIVIVRSDERVDLLREAFGSTVEVLKCRPENLVSAIRSEILAMSRVRAIS